MNLGNALTRLRLQGRAREYLYGPVSRAAGFAVPLSGCGTRTAGVVRCDQPRALDLQARSARYIEQVPAAVMEEVLARLATIMPSSF